MLALELIILSVRTSDASRGTNSPKKGADGRPGGRDDVDGREVSHFELREGGIVELKRYEMGWKWETGRIK